VLNEYGRGFMQVTGPSMKTTDNLAKASGRPIIYNALAPDFDQHGQKTQNGAKIMKWLDEANTEKGLRIFGQAATSMGLNSPQRFSLDIFNLMDASPPWRRVTIGSPEERIAKMNDPKLRQACHDQFDNPNKVSQLSQIDRAAAVTSEIDGGMGFSLRKLVLHKGTTERTKQFEGMNLATISEKTGNHIVDCFLDLSIEDGLMTIWEQIAQPVNLVSSGRSRTAPTRSPG